MHSRRRITLLILLVLTGLACFVLRTDYFSNLTSTGELTAPKPLETIPDMVEIDSLASSSPSEVEIVVPIVEEGVATGTDTSTKEEPIFVPDLPPTLPNNSCYVGGCSGQLCSDSQDMASTCEWREQYACYREATCERQVNGLCGWTDTPKLKACLINTENSPIM
jgi:eight-cysteine-cluster-containing protein